MNRLNQIVPVSTGITTTAQRPGTTFRTYTNGKYKWCAINEQIDGNYINLYKTFRLQSFHIKCVYFNKYFTDTTINDVTILYLDPNSGDRLLIACRALPDGTFTVAADVASRRPYIDEGVRQYLHSLLISYGQTGLERQLRPVNQQLCVPTVSPYSYGYQTLAHQPSLSYQSLRYYGKR